MRGTALSPRARLNQGLGRRADVHRRRRGRSVVRAKISVRDLPCAWAGYMPLLLCWLLIASARHRGRARSSAERGWRAGICGPLVDGDAAVRWCSPLLIEPAGLLIAATLAVLVGALGGAEFKLRESRARRRARGRFGCAVRLRARPADDDLAVLRPTHGASRQPRPRLQRRAQRRRTFCSASSARWSAR